MLMRKILDTVRSRWGLGDARTLTRRKRRPRLLVERLEDRCVLATITVTSLSDSTSPGLVTLRDAIQMANADAAADRIVFARVLQGPVSLFSPLTITAPLTIQGPGASTITIAAPVDNRIVNVTAAAGDVTLDGMTLLGGVTRSGNQSNPPGAPGDFTNDGGAIHSMSSGTLTIRNSVLTGNHTLGRLAGGGAIFAYGGPVQIDNSTLSDNYCSFWRGGAIYAVNGAVTVLNSTISGNHTGGTNANGGAIFSANGSVTVTNSTLYFNYTDGMYARGGAIFTRHDIPTLPTPTVTITNSTLSGNFTRGDISSGGAIYARQDTNVKLIDSTVSGNTAQGNNTVGGAIYANAGLVTVSNSTIADNYAKKSGGGILSFFASATVTGSIIARNTYAGGPSDLAIASVTVSHSLIGSNGGTPLTATGLIPDRSENLIGSNAHPIDPMLGPLTNNGGPAQTMALMPNSPAIDRGANPLGLASDQRGFPFARAVNFVPDMGAFEFETSLNLVVTSAADRLDSTFDPTNLTLRDALSLANSIPGADTIAFSSSLTGTPILLGLGELPIKDSVTIQGLGGGTAIDAQHNSRIFNVATGTGDVTMDRLILLNGQAPASGGGAVFFNTHQGNLTVKNSTLSGNASVGPGGAILAAYSSASVSFSTLSNNSTSGARAFGGAIFASQTTVTSSTLSHNSTQGMNANGGGIAAIGVVLMDSTLSGNFTQGANANGGGIAIANNLYGPNLGLYAANSTIAGNSAMGASSAGGGIFSANSAILSSTIVAGNHDSGSNPDVGVGTGPLVVADSLIGDNTGTGLAATGGTMPGTNGDFIGTAANPMNPMLGLLQNNGGTTQTMALLPSSRAIDHGVNALNLAADQRGFLRVFGTGPDMGAFEAQPPLRLRVVKPKDTLDNLIDPNFLSLRDAITLANNSPGSDIITIDPSLRGVPLQLSLGELKITDPVTIQGLGPADTIIDARQQSRIFDIAPTGGDVTLDGLTLTGGHTTAQGDGGGAIRFQSTGTLTVRNCTISGNSTQGDFSAGAGVYAIEPDGALQTGGDVTVSHSTISGNSTAGFNAPGGGIFVNGGLTMDASTIADNFTQGRNSFGGGIWVSSASTMTMTNSTVSGNFTKGANSHGGGIIVNGGGVKLSNSTVFGNSAQEPSTTGGGMYVEGGGGVALHSSILAGNADSGGNPDLGAGTSPLTVTNSLIGTNQGTTLTSTGPTPDANGDLIGSAGSPINPLLGPLQDNGGPTLTRALLPGSPALGRGDNSLELSNDQRGGDFLRQVGAAVDMGAFQIQVVPPPPPPLALNDHVTVLENSGPNPLNVLSNDRGSGLTVTGITQPFFGQALILPGGSGVSYLPNHKFDSLDQFTYTVTDRDGRTATATVFVNVSGANMPPLAQDDAVTILDTGVADTGSTPINVLANDSGNHLRIVTVTQGSNGGVVIDPILGQNLGYIANTGFHGTDTFTYTIQDDLGRTATATVTVTVVDTSMPMAHDDTVTVPPNSPNSSGTGIDVLANDTGRHLQVTAVTQPAHGTVTLMPVSLLVYQPNPNYLGPDSFMYTVTDDKGHTSSATVNVMVVDPTLLHIQDQTATVPENGGPIGIDLLAHDTGEDLFVTGVTQASHGTVQPPDVDHRTVSYTPGPNFAGTDTFTFTVLDGNGQTMTAHVTITVVGPSAPLAAQDDAVVVPAGSGPNPVNVLGNDTGSGVQVTAITQRTHGAVVILPSGEGVTYQPIASFTGMDHFTYTVTDANGQTATATVTVTTVANFSPIAQVTGPATGQAGQSLAVTVSASDVSADPAPGFTYVVNWGDGSPAQTIPASPGNGAGVVVSHFYAVAGSYTVQVSAVNQDGNTSPVATTTVAIAAAPTTPQPIGLTPVLQSVGKGKHRRTVQFVQVAYSNGATRLLPVPFTKPRSRAILWVLADQNGDGVFDTVIFTARLARTGKKVQRMVQV
jgi:hypothetical protein